MEGPAIHAVLQVAVSRLVRSLEARCFLDVCQVSCTSMPERAYISLTTDRRILVLQWQFNAYQLVNIASHSWPKISLLDSSKENGVLLLG